MRTPSEELSQIVCRQLVDQHGLAEELISRFQLAIATGAPAQQWTTLIEEWVRHNSALDVDDSHTSTALGDVSA